ncbi:MAG: hypothetical protein JWM44_2725 [Bacilli bacterium]|nr:hypothetical protein [Bacilli bacterium]
MNLSRRDFILRGTALLATLGIGAPLLLTQTSNRVFGSAEPTKNINSPVLVVIQMSGGNDGLNTIIPYGSGAYFDARPTLSITQKEVLTLDKQMGLHPSLAGLNELYNRGKVAIIQGVGYPKPNHSHFRSMEIWQTAEPDKYLHSGWLGRYVETSLQGNKNPLQAIQIGNEANKAFSSDSINVPVIQTLDNFNFFDPHTPVQDQNRLARSFIDMYNPNGQGTQIKVTCQHGMDAYHSVEAVHTLSSRYQNKVVYPKSGIAKDLQLVVKMLAGQSNTRVFYLQIGGFDDHAREKEQQAKVLKELDEGLSTFYEDLEAQGLQDNVVTMAFSEFGRRVKENGSGGTDHGTAGPIVVLGGKVKGGLYGEAPNLTDLDKGDLKYQVDFRSVYSTIMDNWLKGDAKAVLGKTYENLTFI